MAQARKLNLAFPVGGLNRRLSFQAQPPYTTPDCLNVRSDDPLEGRQRGGSRPGLVKSHQERLGQNWVNLLDDVRTLIVNPSTSQIIDFPGTQIDPTVWGVGAWMDHTMEVEGGYAFVRHDPGPPRHRNCALYAKQIKIDTSRSIQLWVPVRFPLNPILGESGQANVIGYLDELNPQVPVNSVEAIGRFYRGTGTFPWKLIFTLRINKNGVQTNYDSQEYQTSSTFFRLFLDVSDARVATVSFSFGGSTLPVVSASIEGQSPSSNRVGFSMQWLVGDRDANKKIIADQISFRYYEVGQQPSRPRNFLVAHSASQLYRDSEDGRTMRPVSQQDAILSSDRRLWSASHEGRLFIADWGEPNAAIRAKVYYPTIGGDPNADKLVLWTATSGEVPANCQLISRHRDRIVLAGAAELPHVWYMSAIGDPFDWFGSGLPDGAQSGDSADAGNLFEPITALIPYSNDYMIFGCSDSIWALRGDPGFGAVFDNLTHAQGIIDNGAWANGPIGEIFFLSRDGLYVLPSATGGEIDPISLSREKLPEELRDVDREQVMVSMAYDVIHRGLHIYLVPRLPSDNILHFWHSLESKGFWPVTHRADLHPITILRHEADLPGDTSVIMGGRDGYLRKMDRGAASDDGTPFDSHVLYGPVLMGQSGTHEGMATELDVVLPLASGPVGWGIKTGATIESALSNGLTASGVRQGGRSGTDRFRARGYALFLRVSGLDGNPWSIEEAVLGTHTTGRIKIS